MRVLGSKDFVAFARELELRALVVTQGDRGATVADANGTKHLPTIAVSNPVDVCGAGDSFSAGTASALASGATMEEAVHFGNLVASITVMKPGTGTADPIEVLDAHEKWSSVK